MSAVQPVGKNRKYNVRNLYKFQKTVNSSNEHCSVPLCLAARRYNSSLSFHRIPKNPSIREQWLHQIKRTGLSVSPNTKVCSRHFVDKQIISTTRGKRVLTASAVPLLFQWNNYTWEQQIGTSSPERDPEPEKDIEQTVPMVVTHDYVAGRTLCVDREQYEHMLREVEALRQQLQTYQLQNTCGLQRFASSPEDIQFYTRFPSYDHLMAFWKLIEAETSKIVKVTRASKASTTSTTTESHLIMPTKLLPIDQLFLFLTFLSTGCTQRELGHKFNIHRTTVSHIIVTWANVLYSLLGSVSIWMSPATVKASLPGDFDGSFKNTQVVIDRIELRCQTPSLLLHQREVFATVKAMVGMSPHGALTFVSALYEGSVRDEDVFHHSGMASLLTPDMAIMVDKGFLVDDLVPGCVHRLAFLSKRARRPEATQSIDRLRDHVWRLTSRIKENKLFETVIPLCISGSINQLFTVACLLSNYQNEPLVKKWRYTV